MATKPGIIQNEADALPEVVVVYRDAVSFVEWGWMQPDNVHWAQPGLNEAGAEGGQVVAQDRLGASSVDLFGLTLEGQYIVKNIVLIAAGIVDGGTVRCRSGPEQKL